jgi:hypothetical protein
LSKYYEYGGINSLVALPNNRMLALASSGDLRLKTHIVRINADLKLDKSFSGNGAIDGADFLTSFGREYALIAFALDSAGRILAFARSDQARDSRIVRFSADGMLDETFVSPVGIHYTEKQDVVLKVAPTGAMFVIEPGGLQRILPNGVIDLTIEKISVANTPGWVNIQDIRFLASGEFMLLGELIEPEGRNDFRMGYFLANGQLNPTYGDNGWIRILPVSASGRFSINGSVVSGSQNSVRRFSLSGELTSSSTITTTMPAPATVGDFCEDTLGRMYFYVYRQTSAMGGEGRVIRLMADGQRDMTFGPRGSGEVSFSSIYRPRNCLATDTGYTVSGGADNFWPMVARVDTNGAPDPAHGTVDYSLIDIPSALRQLPIKISIDVDHLVLVVRQFSETRFDSRFFAIDRLHSSGGIDSTYALPRTSASALYVQPDGSILHFRRSTSGGQLTQYGRSGRPVADFGNGGTISTSATIHVLKDSTFLLIDVVAAGLTVDRYSSAGKILPGFATTSTLLPQPAKVTGAGLDSFGNVVLAGVIYSTPVGSTAQINIPTLWHLGAGGGLSATNPITGLPGELRSVQMLDDGRVFIAGDLCSFACAPTRQSYVAAVKQNGTVDVAFGTTGWITFTRPSTLQASIDLADTVILTTSNGGLMATMAGITHLTNGGVRDAAFAAPNDQPALQLSPQTVVLDTQIDGTDALFTLQPDGTVHKYVLRTVSAVSKLYLPVAVRNR